MHLKNIGLRYPDGHTAELPPAYDIVAYAAYGVVQKGRGLRLLPQPRPGEREAFDPQAPLGPAMVRHFCTRLGLPEKPAFATLRRSAAQALQAWPALIAQAEITAAMKTRLLERLEARRRGA